VVGKCITIAWQPLPNQRLSASRPIISHPPAATAHRLQVVIGVSSRALLELSQKPVPELRKPLALSRGSS
jgi:hypothetical protein